MKNKLLILMFVILLLTSFGFVSSEVYSNPNYVAEEKVCDVCEVCETLPIVEETKTFGRTLGAFIGGILITLAFINLPKRKKKVLSKEKSKENLIKDSMENSTEDSTEPKHDEELNQLIKDTGLEDIKDDVESLK